MENKEYIKQIYINNGLDEESFFLEMLFAIFCKMKKERFNELPLDSKSVSEYAPKLESLFERYDIISDAFSRTPVDETYDNFSTYAIQILIGGGYGYFNDSYNKITIEINPYMINKTLKKYEELIDFINEGYACITNDLTNIEEKESAEKKLKLSD